MVMFFVLGVPKMVVLLKKLVYTILFILIFQKSFAFEIDEKNKIIQIKISTTHSGSITYYRDLLENLIHASGYQLKIDENSEIPQPRIAHELERGKIDIYWFLETPERNSKFLFSQEYVDKKMTGHRLLLIPKGQQPKFDNIHTIEDFKSRKLIGALGSQWYDALVWKKNDLPVKLISGDWIRIYDMLSNHEIDYFPRSVLEVSNEVKKYQGLTIEKNLQFIYENSMKFYISKNAPNAQIFLNILNQTMGSIKGKEVIDQIFEKYFGDTINQLSLEKRVKLHI